MAEMISFARGAPSLDIVDVEGLKIAAENAFTSDAAGTTAYGTSIGYVPLRRWIAEQHGVAESRVLVTNGSMQADAFLFDALVQPGDAVVVEKPTYDRTLLGLRQRGADVHMVELEPDGIDIAALRTLLEGGVRPKLAHIIPNFQNPAGYTLSREKRVELLRLARGVRASDLRGRPVHRDPLHGRAAADDALARRQERRARRLRLVVLQDGLPRHPRRLPRRARGAHRDDRAQRDEHVHLAEHGRPVDRLPVLRERPDPRRGEDRQRARSPSASRR